MYRNMFTWLMLVHTIVSPGILDGGNRGNRFGRVPRWLHPQPLEPSPQSMLLIQLFLFAVLDLYNFGYLQLHSMQKHIFKPVNLH